MEYFDLWDSCMIKSLKLPKSGNQLRFLIQRVPSGGGRPGRSSGKTFKNSLTTAATYKRGLATVKEQLVTIKKNEVLLSEEVTVLKREVACKNYKINILTSEFEKVKQEKEGTNFKIEKFDNVSKSLDKLIGSQITDNNKKGLGYHAIPPPHPLIYNGPIKLNLFYSGLDEFKEPEFKGYGLRDSKPKANINHDQKSNDSKENADDSFVKHGPKDSKLEVEDLQYDLKQTKLTYGSAYTKLILRVNKLEHKVKTSQHRRTRVVLSDDEEDLEDPSKQERKITKIDEFPSISLVQDEGTSSIQEDYEIQGKTSADTKILLDQEEPTELVEDLGSGEKCEKN
uniref:Uncharacterized protein n=1 Tax=Tanacetum cinerariifolium TaxID=118510 RepID=A0A6L2M2G4_TANCI|nr:hypothetical protein [Tanacetum cinerariifolium]